MSERRSLRPALLLAAIACAPGASALELQPGLWEFQITVQSGMMGNQTLTQQQCIQETDLDPSMFMTQMGPCSLGEISENARGLNWTFSCNLQGVTTEGSGTMTTVGDTVRGSVTMNMAMPGAAGGQTFTLENTWSGRRVGECR